MIETRFVIEEFIDILHNASVVPESSSLDYKVRPHEKGHDCELFKDVLALANAYDNPDEDRWLIYGVDNEKHRLIGIDESDPNLLDDAAFQEKFEKVKERIIFRFVRVSADEVGVRESQNKIFAAFYIPKENAGILHELGFAIQDKVENKKTHRTTRYEVGTSFVRIGSSTKPMTEEHRAKIRALDKRRVKLPSIAYAEMRMRSSVSSGVERLRLLGSWNSENENDRAVVAKLYGSSYNEAVDALRDELEAGLFTIEGPVWKVRDRIAALESVGGHLTTHDLDQLTKVLKSVFESVDEALTLSPESRLLADVKGVNRGCSSAIRSGAAAFYACLANNRTLTPHFGHRSLEQHVSSIIRTAVSTVSWETIAANDAALPLLAEASTSLYLNAVSDAIGLDTPLVHFLGENTGGLISTQYGYGLVRGIVYSALSSENLSQSIVVLTRLLPYTTLAKDAIISILLPWMPLTDAAVESRVGMARYLAGCGDKEAWSVLLELLPGRVSSAMGIEQPQFLRVGDINTRATFDEYLKASRGYCMCALESAQTDIDRMVELSSNIDAYVSAGLLDECLEVFRASDLIKCDLDCYRIWNVLSDYIVRCERYPDSTKTPDEGALDALHAFISEVRPKDSYYIALRSCSTQDFKLCSTSFADGLHEEALSMRTDSIRRACDVSGITVVRRLAKDGALPSQLGEALACVTLTEEDQDYLLAFMDDPQIESGLEEVAQVFVWCKFKKEKWPWVDSLDMKRWPRRRISGLLSALPADKEVWKKAEYLLGAESRQYWSRVCDPFTVDNEADVDHCVGKLLVVGRSSEALACIYDAIDSGIRVSPETVLKAIEASNYTSQGVMNDYYIEELFKYVESLEESERLWLLELKFFHLMAERKDSYLFKRLSKDPSTFIMLVRYAYSTNDSSVIADALEDETPWGIRSHLLGEWVIVPGYGSDGLFRPESFSEWLEAVEDGAEKSGVTKAAEWEIGRNLFHATPIEGGLFVPLEIMEFLDSRKNARDGYASESINSRGVHFVDTTGAEEDAIAQSFDEKALAAEARGYIHFSVTLRKIARAYRSEAEENREIG